MHKLLNKHNLHKTIIVPTAFVLLFATIGIVLLLSGKAATNPVGDLNGDGTVNIFDLSILLGHYGT